MFKTSCLFIFLLISVAAEADDQCGTQTPALNPSVVQQQQQVERISFCKNLCVLGVVERYRRKIFNTLLEENRWMAVCETCHMYSKYNRFEIEIHFYRIERVMVKGDSSITSSVFVYTKVLVDNLNDIKDIAFLIG